MGYRCTMSEAARCVGRIVYPSYRRAAARGVGRIVYPSHRRAACALVACSFLFAGCTTFTDWIRNGFKVGPNDAEPAAPVSSDWIGSADPHLVRTEANDGAWWQVFGDPALSFLVDTAYQQNLDLKTAAARVLEARAQRNITAGNLLPQSQKALFDYAHAQIGRNLNIFGNPQAALPNTLNVWATGFNASWELDFWGRLRRAVESSNADLDASVESYHDALVTLVADVANTYVQIRTSQQRIAYARRNVEIQTGSLRLAEARLKDGKATALDVEQARSSLAQTRSSIAPLAIGLRQANDRLCILLGEAPRNMVAELNQAAIPTAPADLAIGLPADLLQRRPDVRQARRKVAAQSAQIGVAEADLYPQIGVSGFIGYTADDLRKLFEQKSFTAFILPNVQWKILNYGRVVNNIRTQDARLKQRVLQYQQTVLTAGREVEDALEAFLQYHVQTKNLEESVQAAERSVELVLAQYKAGLVDYNRVFTTQATRVTQQDQLALARGNIALSLIAVYRALGGGWRFFEEHPAAEASALFPPAEK